MFLFKIIKLSSDPSWILESATWFSKKWSISYETYKNSMEESLTKQVPQWYIVVCDDKIIGGCGVIENDFHDRKDLTPNLCALYVEEAYRNQKVAGTLLDYVCKDMKERGIDRLYLLTNHTNFYERYGWEFECFVQGEGEEYLSRMYKHE